MYWDTEEWVESGFEYALSQNTQLASLGIDSFVRNPTINDELEFPHVQVECVAVYPASSTLTDKTEICEVEITARTSQGVDEDDPDNVTSVERQLLHKIAGAIRAVLYAPASDLSPWITTGGNARYLDAFPIIQISNVRYQAERMDSTDISDKHYHSRIFTISLSVEPDPAYA
jgi:hypothetical protein